MRWKAGFAPKVWIGNCALTIELGVSDCSWEISPAEAADAVERARGGETWNYLLEHDNAPEWVREYSGPFAVEIIGPDGKRSEASDYR